MTKKRDKKTITKNNDQKNNDQKTMIKKQWSKKQRPKNNDQKPQPRTTHQHFYPRDTLTKLAVVLT